MITLFTANLPPMVEEGEKPPAYGERGLGLGRQESGAHLSSLRFQKGIQFQQDCWEVR